MWERHSRSAPLTRHQGKEKGKEKGTGCFSLRFGSYFAYLTYAMPCIPRGQVAGYAYHILNRGNGGATVFHKDGGYTAFLNLLATAKAKCPVKLFGDCLMPNHFHWSCSQPLMQS